MRSSTFSVLLSLLCLGALACSSGGGGDDDDFSDVGENSGSSGAVAEEGGLKSTCGAVIGSKRYSPVDTARGEAVTLVSVQDSNLVTLRGGEGEFVAKLHALGSTAGFENTQAAKTLGAHASESLFFFPVGCTETVGGAAAQVGQVIAASGTSFSEEVLRERIGGVIEASGDCAQSLISGCYKGIVDPDSTVSSDGGTDVPVSGAGEVSNFLWKPESESPYNPGGLSILLNPCNARVLVNGEELRDYGGTNGRCVTARSAKSGCDFGTNVKVEAIDSASGLPFTFNGQPFLTIADGCARTEFNAGAVASEDEPVDCETAPLDFQYKPKADECGGNAAVVVSGSLAGAFSIQLRLADGGDRLDEECADASCSPYKVQRYIDGAGSKTGCFGAPGDAVVMSVVRYSTVKMAGDDHDPGRYCIPDPALQVN